MHTNRPPKGDRSEGFLIKMRNFISIAGDIYWKQQHLSFYLEIPSELIGIRKIMENNQFWSVLNWEILEHEPFWLSFELRNTGTRTSLITWKSWILYISLNPDFLVFLQKRRAPKFHAFWRAACAEISHMRPIQARKLKLLKWPFPGDFQVTPTAATATARRQFFYLARALAHSVQGWNIPFGNPSLRLKSCT